jgi:hypothetical protein
LADAAHFIKQAVDVFDELVQNAVIKEILIVADGAQKTVTTLGSGVPNSVARLVQAGLQTSAEKVSVY